jgi:hypothetical protein
MTEESGHQTFRCAPRKTIKNEEKFFFVQRKCFPDFSSLVSKNMRGNDKGNSQEKRKTRKNNLRGEVN